MPFADTSLTGPSPLGQSLRVELPCVRSDGTPAQHELVIEGSWSTTPLPDAFWHWSGHTGCWWAYDRAVLAARHCLDLRARRTPPAIARHADGWQPFGAVDRGPGWRSDSSVANPVIAAQASRSSSLVAERFRADRDLTRHVVEAVDLAHGGVQRPERSSADPWLWEVGVPPSFVDETSARLSIGSQQLNRTHYLAAALAAGPPSDVLPVDPVERLAYRTGLTATRARSLRNSWARLDQRVGEDDQVLVNYLSETSTLPGRAALDRLTATISNGVEDVRITLLLAITGNVPDAGALWRSGAREPLIAAAIMARS